MIIIVCINWYPVDEWNNVSYGTVHNNIAGVSRPGLSEVNVTCNKDRDVTTLAKKHFSVCFTNMMHTSTCPLL